MSERISQKSFYGLQAALPNALIALGNAAAAELEASLIHLVKLRVSQLNHCAFCQHMHAAEARKDGERQERLDVLAAWREAGCFSAREVAALNWAERCTLLANETPSDKDFDLLKAQFSEREIANLLAVIITINGWNRIAVSLGFAPAINAL